MNQDGMARLGLQRQRKFYMFDLFRFVPLTNVWDEDTVS